MAPHPSCRTAAAASFPFPLVAEASYHPSQVAVAAFAPLVGVAAAAPFAPFAPLVVAAEPQTLPSSSAEVPVAPSAASHHLRHRPIRHEMESEIKAQWVSDERLFDEFRGLGLDWDVNLWCSSKKHVWPLRARPRIILGQKTLSSRTVPLTLGIFLNGI